MRKFLCLINALELFRVFPSPVVVDQKFDPDAEKVRGGCFSLIKMG